MSVKQKRLCLSLCSRMFDDVEQCSIWNIQNDCHANEQLPLCYYKTLHIVWPEPYAFLIAHLISAV